MSELEVVKAKIAVAETDLAKAKTDEDKDIIKMYGGILLALQQEKVELQKEKNFLLQQGILFYQ